MFFTGAVGALLMYSVLKTAHHHHPAHEQRIGEHEDTSQPIPGRRWKKHREESNSRTVPDETSTQNETLLPEVIYIPREIVREVVVDCSCKCAYKADEKLERPRSFWNLDQGKFIRSAGSREAEKTREKKRLEIAKMTTYWSLDQGMHADEKGTV